MINVLWLCNIVLPDFSQEFGIKRASTGGWMTGMLHALEAVDMINISLCFPIYDKSRLKSGVCGGHMYFTFLRDSVEEYSMEMINSFERILEESQPNIVHIWGTEFPHTTAMLLACRNKGILNRTVIHLQGLVSVIAGHYRSGIPDKYWSLKKMAAVSMEEAAAMRVKRGKCEIESLKMVRYVIGRTTWDRACVEAINPKVHYYSCDEILRDIFYEYAGLWRYDTCQKYSIFISQATYPIKGFHYFLQALSVIIRKYPDTQVFVAGIDIVNVEKKDAYAVYIEKLIEELALDKAITFLGSLDEGQMVEQYLKANVFVLASVMENSPNSLNEAMLIGVPSVASYVGGICDRIHMNTDGFLYPYDEPELLAYYVCKIFENKEGLCQTLSGNSVKASLQFTDPEKNRKQMIHIYEEISGQGEPYAV